MKICSTCFIQKPLSDFNKVNKDRPHRHSNCKPCNKRKRQQWLDANPDKAKALKDKKNKTRFAYSQHKKDHCDECGFKAKHSCQLDVDHVNGNHKDNDINNLRTLCANCHRYKTWQNNDIVNTKLRNTN